MHLRRGSDILQQRRYSQLCYGGHCGAAVMNDFALMVTESRLSHRIFDSHFIGSFVLLGSTGTDGAHMCSLNESQICLGLVFKGAVYISEVGMLYFDYCCRISYSKSQRRQKTNH